MDYSKTVNLPRTDFPMKADLPRREPEWLAQWEKEGLYEAALARRQGAKEHKRFVLHDGPPYANGHLHVGHALNKILKDIIVRFKTMNGYYAPYVPGWDCHGLPIELALMKEKKIDKNSVDREEFRRQAAAYAQQFVDIQREEFKRMGVLGDWNRPYLTMSQAFKDRIVDIFNRLQAEGYVYRGKKPVYWCATDETALAEAELEYEDDSGPSIFVAFASEADPKTSFVIWTTTPWTLPANQAIAFNADEAYVVVEAADGRQFIVAAKRVEHFLGATALAGRVLRELPGSDLQGAVALHPWIPGRRVPLLAAGFVAMDTGTGLVHIAPGHGREDYQLGMSVSPKLEVFSPVDDRGRLQEPGQAWDGVYVFKANALIIDFLRQRGALLHEGTLLHSYPHCWRCHKPVIFRATEQWFLNIDKDGLRQRVLDAIRDVCWVPGYGENRISGMVEARPDWCLSRQRLWGTSIPSASEADGSGGDIFDVWFESGVSWAAVLEPRGEYPADLYLEGSDQHRGWFQTSLIPSVALHNRAPYKTVLTHGFVMDGQGRPMSKSLGNVISPAEVIRQYGADVLRLWVASSDYAGDVRLGPDILKGSADAYRKIRNTWRYLLNNLFDFDAASHSVPIDQLPELDRWALHRLSEEAAAALRAYDAYEFHRVVLRLVQFCNVDLSGFYLDVLKDRLYCDPADSPSRRSAQTVLYHLADRLIRLLAPVLSFTADEAWRFMGHRDGVALADLELPPAAWPSLALGERFARLLQLRVDIQGEMEKARAQNIFKAPREAKITMTFRDPEPLDFVLSFGPSLAAYLGVSEVVCRREAGLPEARRIQAEATALRKCERCWIHKADIGAAPAHPGLCARCAAALEEGVAA